KYTFFFTVRETRIRYMDYEDLPGLTADAHAFGRSWDNLAVDESRRACDSLMSLLDLFKSHPRQLLRQATFGATLLTKDMKANIVGVLWFLCPSGTAMDIRVQEASTGHSTLAAQFGIPFDKVRLTSVAGGGNYGRPLNNCEEGCACNTDSAIVIHDSEGRVMWAVCANGCESSSSCPSYQSLMIRCAPLERCFIRCIFAGRVREGTLVSE
ncbi:hypothetical protein FOZ62_007771, partial [Perkinsus olseni]